MAIYHTIRWYYDIICETIIRELFLAEQMPKRVNRTAIGTDGPQSNWNAPVIVRNTDSAGAEKDAQNRAIKDSNRQKI